MKMEFVEYWAIYSGDDRLFYEQAKLLHEKEKPYFVIISDEKPRFIVGVYFNYEGYFCSVDYLNQDLEKERTEAYVVHNQQLFLKNVHEFYYDGREVDLETYLYEIDGRYRKNFFSRGTETKAPEYGTCDVSSHFREMIHYDSILPEEAKRGLGEG